MTAWDLLFGRYLCFFRGIFPLSSAIRVFLYCKVGFKLNTQIQQGLKLRSFWVMYCETTLNDISEFSNPTSIKIVPKGGPPFWLIGFLFG